MTSKSVNKLKIKVVLHNALNELYDRKIIAHYSEKDQEKIVDQFLDNLEEKVIITGD